MKTIEFPMYFFKPITFSSPILLLPETYKTKWHMRFHLYQVQVILKLLKSTQFIDKVTFLYLCSFCFGGEGWWPLSEAQGSKSSSQKFSAAENRTSQLFRMRLGDTAQTMWLEVTQAIHRAFRILGPSDAHGTMQCQGPTRINYT